MTKDKTGAPRVTEMKIVPVAGQDSMLLNLSGAHAPYFTRNLVILTDSAGNTGVGEVPGGEKIRQTLEEARDLVIGVTLALADGTLAMSGGKVVKNVAGYDLPKLVTGALGTLGMITTAVFRLHPLPKTVENVSLKADSLAESERMVLQILDSDMVPAALCGP